MRGALSTDLTKIDWRFTIRSTIGVAICLIGGLMAGSTLYALAASIGALSVGFASLSGIHRTRALAMLGTAVAMGASAFVAGYAAPYLIADVLLAAILAFAYGIFASLGESAASIGLNAVLAFIILGSVAGEGAHPGLLALLTIAGGLVQTLVTIASWPVSRHAEERRALGKAYRSLAAYVRGDYATAPPSSDVMLAVRAALADPQPFGHSLQLAALQTLADEAERIRAGLAWSVREVHGSDDGLSVAASQLLDAIADALDAAVAPKDARGSWDVANAALTQASPDWQALFGQIRAAWRSAAFAPQDEAPARISRSITFPNLEHSWMTLRASLTPGSPFARNALRLGATFGAAMLLYRWVHFPHGYWIALTALLVLRPDYTTTLTRGIGRLVGTLAGGVLAGAIAFLIPHSVNVEIALAILFTFFCYALIRVNYAIYSCAITLFVVFILSAAGLPEHSAIVARVLATICGGVLAAVAYTALPMWESTRTPDRVADLFDASRALCVAILAVYADPSADASRLRALQTHAWVVRSSATSSVERMLTEPSRKYELSARTALALMAASRRIGLANLALDSHVGTKGFQTYSALQPFANAVDVALKTLTVAIRTATVPAAYPPLRPVYALVQQSLANAQDADAPTILDQCDLIVDSVNTAADALREG